jgi:hypothetical protein
MGLMIHSLENIPLDAKRNYFIYLLDYGWEEPISEVLNHNFDKMASIASANKAVIIKGTELAHFENEVLSWHHINNEDAHELLPALLITNKHPKYFLEQKRDFSGRKNTVRVDDEYETLKMILVPFRKLCKSTTDVVSIIEKIFSDISNQRDLKDFKVAKELKRGIGYAIVDSIILEPEIYGVGFSFKKLKEYFSK